MNNKFLIFKGKYLKKLNTSEKNQRTQRNSRNLLQPLCHSPYNQCNPSMTSFNKLMKCKATENKS